MQDQCFYYDIRTGEIVSDGIYSVTSDNILTEADFEKYWHLIEEADHKELLAFAKNKVFRPKRHSSFRENVVDAIWVRRWKQTLGPDGKSQVWIVKSRLCGRGFLDSQKNSIQRHSSTASRISQRMIVSIATLYGFDLESWDVSNAFPSPTHAHMNA